MNKGLFSLVLMLAAGAEVARSQPQSPFEDFSFEQVEQIVRTRHPADLSELLAALPAGFLSSYTLVHDSKSIQQADFANPRAIVFGRTARFIMAFNGDPSQPGYERLEMLQFREADQHYELRQVTFGARGATISEKNPRRCVACHGEVPHPIWQSYSSWPGVYGSGDDNVDYAEETQFKDFVAAAPQHPRYKYLHARPDLSDRWPYRSETVNSGKYSEYHVYRPNDRLGRLLAGRAALSARSLLDGSPFFRAHRNAVLFHLLRCDQAAASAPYHSAVDRVFERRFPAAANYALYGDLATVTDPHYRSTVELEKLILGSGDATWNLSLGFLELGDRFTPDGFDMNSPDDFLRSDIDDLLSVRVLEEMSETNDLLKQHFHPISAIENYVRANGADRAENLTSWGIAADYDAVMRFMDYPVARSACPSIESDALKELAK